MRKVGIEVETCEEINVAEIVDTRCSEGCDEVTQTAAKAATKSHKVRRRLRRTHTKCGEGCDEVGAGAKVVIKVIEEQDSREKCCRQVGRGIEVDSSEDFREPELEVGRAKFAIKVGRTEFAIKVGRAEFAIKVGRTELAIKVGAVTPTQACSTPTTAARIHQRCGEFIKLETVAGGSVHFCICIHS